MEHPLHSATKGILDALSLATVLATLTTYLPPAAALASLIWTVMRIWEMLTGKKIADRRKKSGAER